MSAQDDGRHFSGSIPKIYERLLVPLIFRPYADDLVARLAAQRPAQLLELAAGTGVVTRTLLARLPASVAVTATDLNQAMLDEAAAVGTSRSVTYRQADAMKLPFPDESFDTVVCQFGVMFFPDKARAFAETRRVLRPGGLFLFNVWGPLDANEITDTISTAVQELFPDDPPRFMARTPHGYHDRTTIARDLVQGGFTAAPAIETVSARARAADARHPAVAFCQGTPLRLEIEARGDLERATDVATAAVTRRFGPGPVEGQIQALVVSVTR